MVEHKVQREKVRKNISKCWKTKDSSALLLFSYLNWQSLDLFSYLKKMNNGTEGAENELQGIH